MSTDPIKVSKRDPDIRRIVDATFPDYRGRKITVRPSTSPIDTRSFWEGGSRSYFAALGLGSTRVLHVPQNGTAFDGGPIRPDGVAVPVGFAIVEHRIFCGKDVGISIHVHPDSVGPLLPAEAVTRA